RLGVLLSGALFGTACSGLRPRLVAEDSARSRPPGTPTLGATHTPPGPPRSFTVVTTGDMLIHAQLAAQAAADARRTGVGPYDFRPVLRGIMPLLSGADLAIGQQGTPLAPVGGQYFYYPTFSAPPQLAGALAAADYDT